MRKRPERAFPFLRGCAGMSDRRERKATPSGVFDWMRSGQSGAWGNPNERIGKSEKDIPIHCSPFPSEPRQFPMSQVFSAPIASPLQGVLGAEISDKNKIPNIL